MSNLSLISVVDDDTSVRESLQGLIRSVGLPVEGFASAEEFLKSDHLRNTRCLILDVRMPGMNGLELQRRLAVSHCEIPVIFITAHGDEAARAQSLKDGAVDYLLKPFTAEALLNAIHAALRAALKLEMILMILLAAAFWLLAAPASIGQTREQDPRQPGQPGQMDAIRVETSLVTVPAIVTDRAGRFTTGLSRGDFQLFEDGKPQEITSFSSTETPFNVALLIDTSRSTREVLGEIRKAARNFVNQLQPQDRVLIVTFDEQVNFRGDFTSDRRKLRRTINSVKSGYLTTVYDAASIFTISLRPKLVQSRVVGVDKAVSAALAVNPTKEVTAFFDTLVEAANYLSKTAESGSRRAIVVISDGEDTMSEKFGRGDALRELQQAQCLFYSINPSGLADPSFSRRAIL